MTKQKRKQILLICPKCNKEYYKDLSEYNRNIKLNRISYCSISCSTDINRIPLEKRLAYNISKHSDNKRDEFTDFRYHFKMLSNKNRNKIVSITLENLKEIWDNQNGICPYTKIKLIHQTHSKNHINYPFYMRASIDRIDSSKGYTYDNVEFVSLAINYLKNKHSKKEVFDFLNLIKNLELDA